MFNNQLLGGNARFTANTGTATIASANSGLDGSGTLGDVLRAASNGTFIEKVTIKAQTAVSQGVVRLFIYDGTNTRLLYEIDIDPTSAGSGTWQSYVATLNIGYFLQASDVLKASTQNKDTFNVIAEGYDITYP